MKTGRIRKALSGFYYVESDGETLTCRARGKFRKDGVSPLVGDRVEVRELGAGEGLLQRVLPRRNAFSRPAVANIDQMVIIASAAPPVTDPFLIDRMMSVAVFKDCQVLLLLNKCDLNPADRLYDIYRAAGVETLRVSAETGEGIDALQTLLQGKLSAFTGNSGVGKSSILNELCPAFGLQTGEISDALGRGRHTTRHIEIYNLPGGGEAVDTPGFSSFETEELNLELKAHLPETFPEFGPYLSECRFAGCSHTKERGCAVLDALRRGEIQPSRHSSYVRLYEELKPLREWQTNAKQGGKAL
ncbi:MAG: ribosome small subunit-dependent GTPase A [Oscillibacter sp.]|nr:ribosome small subunit-dependent GTPase A [Oscillibacter sp.]